MSLIRTIVDAVSLGAGISAAWSPYVQMGQGIAGRSLRCQRWWSPHLRLTKEFIEQNLQPVNKIAILGAGRLLDINLPFVLERCKEVHLFDLDPSAVDVWRKSLSKVDRERTFFRCEDVTSCMRVWGRELRRASHGRGVAETLSHLKAPTPYWTSESFDGVISLNILGQIPLYWRDRVINTYPVDVPDFSNGLCRSMAELQAQHICSVMNSPTCWGMIISDSEYYYYREGNGVWEWEDALFQHATRPFREFVDKATAYGTWWWHLAPQFIEHAEYGEIHKVEAAFISNRSPLSGQTPLL